MSFDAHSLERLKALGRSLPKPLPAPEPQPAPQARQHPVETEQNPDQLFRELMMASADGTVPPHLLDRLRQLETASSRQRPAAGVPPRSASPPAQRQTNRRSSSSEGDLELYEAFADLLSLESDDGPE